MEEAKTKTIRVGLVWIRTAHELREARGIHGCGTITQTYTKKPSLEMCAGCRDNFYNGSNNSVDGQCWSFRDAEVVDKVGYSSRDVGYGPDVIMKRTLSCWHGVR